MVKEKEILKIVNDLEKDINKIENKIEIYKQQLKARKFELKEFRSCLSRN